MAAPRSHRLPRFGADQAANGREVQRALDGMRADLRAENIPYTPAVAANWTTQPTTVAEALDMIAASLGPI